MARPDQRVGQRPEESKAYPSNTQDQYGLNILNLFLENPVKHFQANPYLIQRNTGNFHTNVKTDSTTALNSGREKLLCN
jgi:hypothetical protein